METRYQRNTPCAGRGMILGKFMPPHRGHQFLIDFARAYVERLTVLVCSLEGDPIDGTLRYRWVREMFPCGVDVVHVTEELPQEPADHPDFWDVWRRVVNEAVGEPIDYVFASEPYGWQLADVLEAAFVPADLDRELVPVSATRIRRDPFQHWNMLPECVRPYYLKRVCLIGPESTGKSTLARDLSRQFNTTYVWEYARPLLNPKGGRCEPGDIDRIARGQIASEAALARHANRVLFVDTSVLLTTIWSEMLFGACPAWIYEVVRQRRYDLHLLLDVDVPWVDDEQRYFPDAAARTAFFTRCHDFLERERLPYTIIRGSWEQRLEKAVAAVEGLGVAR